MKEYLNIKRNPIFTTMKTLLFFLPIGIITNNIYVSLYGDYSITFKLVDLNISHAIVSFVFFCIISIVSYRIEREILPSLLISIDKRLNTDSKHFKESNKVLDKVFLKLYGLNPFERIKGLENKNLFKYKLCADLMYYPITGTLWLIAFSSIFSYILILCIAVLSYYIVAGVNSYFYRYGIKMNLN
jgi:hypothetical protein